MRDLEQDMVGLRRTETAHKELLQRSQRLEATNTTLRQQAAERRGGGAAPASSSVVASGVGTGIYC